MLTAMAAIGALFHTASGTAFADLMIDGHRETWPIRSNRFRTWLRRRYYQETGSALSAPTINSALDLLEAQAQFDAPERAVHVRVAEHAGHIYLDLADEDWRAVEIGPGGWRVIESPPVRFRRPVGMLPLPAPQPGGSIEALVPLLNVASRNDFVLVVTWLLAALRPRGPYPVLAISGEPGSAKTVLSKLLKALIDPNVAPVRALVREERDLVIAANHGHLLAFDNLSDLPASLSDAFCRLASGGSFSIRKLYTDDDEVLFQAARPILLNGIEDVIRRPDLADRAIFLTLAAIAEKDRRPEQALWREFEAARPRILGALLDAATHGLRELPRVRFEKLSRMADFALWAMACETALWPASTFARAYGANRSAAIAGVIDADPVAAAVREMMAERSSWTGSAADLLLAGAGCNRDGISRDSTGWPKNARALAGRLRRAQTFLRALGIDITFGREGRAGSRIIRICRTLESTVSTVSSVPEYGGRGQDDRRHRPVTSATTVTAPVGQVSVAAADDADGADANAGSRFG
jgi:hypothetical protein